MELHNIHYDIGYSIGFVIACICDTTYYIIEKFCFDPCCDYYCFEGFINGVKQEEELHNARRTN